jgi:hypothetical protein
VYSALRWAAPEPSWNPRQEAKKQADAHAEGEYEQFAAQRRAFLEAEGAESNVRALEDAANALPKPKRK